MTPLLALSIPVGVTLGLGLWTLLGLVPRVGATRLAARVAPYVADLSPEARAFLDRRPAEPLPFVGGLLAPLGHRIRAGLVAVFGGDDSVERRLHQAGWMLTVEALRGRQLLAGVAGAGVGILFAAALARSPAVSPLLLGVVVAVGLAIGVLLPDQLLSRAARVRRSRIAEELPTVLEFLTLSLSAGEAVLDALRRVARAGNGDLAREIGTVVAQVNAGVPLAAALERCADEIQLPALSRTVDQLVGALDRGSPLVDVLRAQAQDSRDDAKRGLLEAAGKKEIAMIVPHASSSRSRVGGPILQLPDRGASRVTKPPAGVRLRGPPSPNGHPGKATPMAIPTYRDAFAQFLTAQKAAVKFTDPNYSNSAITRERAKRVQAARDALLINARGYGVTQRTTDPAAAIAAAFDGIQARDADSVAVANNEWAKVRTMLDAGRDLGQIIDNSDRRRLSAILDRVEELALDSGDVEGVTSEVQDRVLGRLAEIGDPKAVTAVEARTQARYGDTWNRVIEQAVAGTVSVDARSALLNASAEDYEATFGQDDPEWPEIEQAVAHLDLLAPTLIQEGAQNG